VNELRELWGALEIVYAVMLDEGRTSLTDDERRDVAETVSALRLRLKRQPRSFQVGRDRTPFIDPPAVRAGGWLVSAG
jgi:hypothetical protein